MFWPAGVPRRLASMTLPRSINSVSLPLIVASHSLAHHILQESMAETSDPRFQTYVAAFVPLQKLLNNNAISESSYKAICAILEQELDNRPAQSEQEVINTIQTRAQAQTPPTAPPGIQGNTGAPQTVSRDLKGDDAQSRGYAVSAESRSSTHFPQVMWYPGQPKQVSQGLSWFQLECGAVQVWSPPSSGPGLWRSRVLPSARGLPATGLPTAGRLPAAGVPPAGASAAGWLSARVQCAYPPSCCFLKATPPCSCICIHAALYSSVLLTAACHSL